MKRGTPPVKIEPTDPRDKNVGGDAHKDYFLGEWRFKEGNKDLIVTKWCIWAPSEAGSVLPEDFYTLEIQSSVGDHERVVVPAGDEAICPFPEGKNDPSGFDQPGIPYDKLPKEIDWISANPHTFDNPTTRLLDSQKVIYAIKPDGSVAKGVILKETNGRLNLTGTFKVGDAYKEAKDLTPAERATVEAEFKKERQKVYEKYKGKLMPDPPGFALGCIDQPPGK